MITRKHQEPDLEAKSDRAYMLIEELGIDAFILAMIDMEAIDRDGTICGDLEWAFEEDAAL